MSLLRNINVAFQDTASQDAFGRLKVAEPSPLFDNMFEYGLNAELWETAATGGSVARVANNCAMRLSTGGTTSGNNAILQTRKYNRYQPGRSLNIETTFTMSAAQTGATTRIGYFDANNGIFLERAGTTINIVRRTFVTGSAVDNAVEKSTWNVDKLDGNGISGKTLDLTKANILFIQLQFLGVGRVQVGFVIDGIPYVCHQFLNAGNLSTVYMSTGCLPVRGEVRNTGTAGGTVTMDMFCTSVSSGGLGEEEIQRSIGNGITAVNTTTTLTPILSIRAATLLGGTGGGGSITNRGYISPREFSILVASQNHEYQILRNATLGGGTSWQAVGASSIADYDVASTTISGGTVLDRGYALSTAATRGTGGATFTVNPLVYTGLNSTQDILTIAARTTTGNGSALARITWKEQY